MTPYRHALTAIALATCQLAIAQSQQSAPATGSSNLVTESSGAVMPSSASDSSANAAPKKADKPLAEGELPAAEPRYIIGNDRVIAPAKPVAAVQGAPLSFNFEEAPVAEVVRTILGDILKTDYVLHPPLSGTVTLATRTPIAPDQAVFLLESSLQANGLAMLRDARGTYHVGRPDALRSIGGSVRQVGNGPLPPGSGAIIVPLQYIGASEMASILRPMMPPDAVVRVDNVRNLLILSGTRTQAEGWLDLVNTFDIDLLKGMSVGVFPLKHASIKEVETALRLVSGGGAAAASPNVGGAVAAGTPGAAQANAASAAQAMLGEGNPLFGALRIMPIERLNSILVVTPRASYLEEARRWIEKLDQPSDNGSEPQLFIYQVQNVNAKHLASVLSGIFGGQTGSSNVANSGVAPGFGSATGSSFGQQQGGLGGVGNTFGGGGSSYSGGIGSSARSSGLTGSGFSGSGTSAFGNRNTNAQGTQQQGTLSANLGSVRVMADELNNSVLIWGTRSEYSKIEAALKRLDLPPTQVLIEASIIEVTLNDDLQYGLQWSFNNSRNGYTGQGLVSGLNPTTANRNTLLGGASQGFSYVLSSSTGVQAVLNALADKSLLKVISSPSLMVLDNHTASINVGNQEPVSTTTVSFVDNANASTSSVQYKDTGVNLVVTPSVNAGNIVNMQVDQTVTDLGAVRSNANNQPAFLQRQISSKVAVRSGETIVLGGLIKDNSTVGKAGVPLLQDIPVLGNLFGTNSNTSNRTELLVVLTPRVVRTDIDIREVSEDLRDRMKGLRVIELKERGTAGAPKNPQAPVQPAQPN
ncbi:type II secretion system secretin GspD [Acidovorax sp. NCPPB 3576]|uniref:type II secretion system secretin GspD n=1 Tax=Acidovorax sp. NCPPB 3576 TaxID=2940488 RepID=UPI00234A27AC|nr:type II secretion system secretin GspD [Acidovorax sp. NCPPB 3576]WCM89172.1 type II secretion system secretin GspD [Acidovorax sp. NCPPB 3576]